jgi:hypothetical protein
LAADLAKELLHDSGKGLGVVDSRTAVDSYDSVVTISSKEGRLTVNRIRHVLL